MRAIRLILASLILALYWWVNPRKKPGPRKGYKRKPPAPAEAPGDVDQFTPEVVSAEAVNA